MQEYVPFNKRSILDYNSASLIERFTKMDYNSLMKEIYLYISDIKQFKNPSEINNCKTNINLVKGYLYNQGYIKNDDLNNITAFLNSTMLECAEIIGDKRSLGVEEVSNALDVLYTFEGIRDREEYATYRSVLEKYNLDLVIDTWELCRDFLQRYSQVAIVRHQMEIAADEYNNLRRLGDNHEIAIKEVMVIVEPLFRRGFLKDEMKPSVRNRILEIARTGGM